MKTLILSMALALGPAVVAHELDSENTVSAQQIEKAKDLPQTLIVRTSLTNPKDVQVVHLKERLAPGKKLTGLQFEQVAMNSEKIGIAYDSSNELDRTTSTASWAFGYVGPRGGIYARGGYGGGYGGYYGGAYGGYRGGYGGYYGAGYGGYYPSYGGYYPSYGYGYGNGCGYGGCGGYSPYYANYQYAGYSYGYAPYYAYADNLYNYTYCGWMYKG